MTEHPLGDSSAGAEPPKVWPRTAEGYCSCPYCTAIREGRLAIPETTSVWAKRMGAQ